MKHRCFAVLAVVVLLAAVAIGPVDAAPLGPRQPMPRLYLPLVGRDFPAPLRIDLGSYPESIDPQVASFVNEVALLQLMYEGLTRLDEHLATVPGAAESWQYNVDATQLTFKLRPGLRYSDGSLLNAARYAYSIKRNIDPKTGGEYAAITDEIIGAREWRWCSAPAECDAAKQVVDQSVLPLRADGQACAALPYADPLCNTLKLTLSQPAPYFHTVMSMWVTYPAKEELVAAGDAEWWRDPARQVGNGPFVMTANAQDVITRFVPNTRYWRGRAAYELEFRYIGDSAEAFELYQRGALDIIPSAAEDLPTVNADPVLKAQHLLYPGSCTMVIKFGLAATYKDAGGKEYDSPMKDPKVRQAFALAFDAEGWAKGVDGGLSLVTWTWIPPGFPGYDPQSPMKFDPALARQLLAQSSYGGPEKLNALDLKLPFADTPRNRQRSEWLAANYKAHLGVNFTLDPVDANTYRNLTTDPKTFPLLARQGWCADYPDPQNWLSVYWKSTATFAQRQGYQNEQFDALTDTADTQTNQAARLSLYKQAQQVLLNDFPAAFGYNSTNHYLVKPRVHGLKLTAQDSAWPGALEPLSITLQ